MKYLTYLLAFVLVFSSCSVKKNIGEKSIKNLSAKKIAENHLKKYPNKKTFDSRLKVNYSDSKQSHNFSVQLKIKKDEVIYLKGTKFITVFKVKITPEKVQYYSPFFKSYFDGNFEMIEKFLGVKIGFQELQSLLLGQSVLDLTKEKQRLTIAEKAYQLTPKKSIEMYNINFLINPDNFKLNEQNVRSDGKHLEIKYPEYITTENVLFPKRIIIKAENKSKSSKIEMEVKSVNFNKDLTIPFKIPSGYKKIKF